MPNATLRYPGHLAYGVLSLSAVFTTPGRGWWLAVTFVLVCIGVGRACLSRHTPAALPADARNLLSGLCGFWLLLTALIVLASMAALNLVTGIGVLTVGALVAGTYGWRHPPPPVQWRFRWQYAAIAAALFAILEPTIVRSLLPDSDWDGALYHLPMAHNFVDVGMWAEGLRPAAMYRPGVVQTVYGLFYALQTESAAIPLNALAIAITALVCHRLGRTVFGGTTGLWAAGLFLASNLVLEYAVDVRVEPFLMLFFMFGVYGGALFLRGAGGLAFVGGAVSVGLLAGTKYNGLLYAAMIAAPLSVALWAGPGMAARGRLKLAGLAAAVCLLPSGAFYARNQVLFGNAFHPYSSATKSLNTRFEEFIGERWSKVPEHARPPKHQEQYLKAKKQRAGQKDASQRNRLLVLYHAILEPEKNKPFHWVHPFLLGFLLIPAFVRTRWSLGFWAFSLGGYLCAVTLFARTGDFPVRYLAPLLPVFAVGTAICLSRARPSWLIAGLAVLVAAPVAYGSWRQQEFFRYLRPDRFLFGDESADRFLARVGYNGAILEPDGRVRFENTAIPRLRIILAEKLRDGSVQATDRIFMVAEAKTIGVPLDCIPSNDRLGMNFLNRLHRAEWNDEKLARQFWDQGIRFLFINRGWMHWNNEFSNAPGEILVLALHSLDLFLARHCGQPVHLDSGSFFVPLRPPE